MRGRNTSNNANNNVTPTMETAENMLARTVMNNTYELWGKKIAAVPVALMKLDMSYQRVLSANVKKLMTEWKNSECTFLRVSYRDGYFYVLDGQHRLAVAKAKGIVELPCEIYTGLTQKDEALIFARQNRNVTKLNPFDTYKANLACGDISIPEVRIDMEIARICGVYNVEVKKVGAYQPNPKTLRSLYRARQIVESNGSQVFAWVLNVITSSDWNQEPTAYTKEMLAMLKNFYLEHCKDVNVESNALYVLNHNTPAEITGMAKSQYSEYGLGTALNLAFEKLVASIPTA